LRFSDPVLNTQKMLAEKFGVPKAAIAQYARLPRALQVQTCQTNEKKQRTELGKPVRSKNHFAKVARKNLRTALLTSGENGM